MEPVEGIEKVALLREPVRRSLYFHVRRAGLPVSREEAAGAIGVSRSLAAFHLDRLAEAGLLDVEYRRLSGRTGRGAGRPAKLYRPGGERVEVSLPPRRYELAGELLVEALRGKRPEDTPEEAARAAALRRGRAIAADLAPSLRRRRAGTGRVRAALERLGFEPEEREGEILLRNCPFHELAARHPDLVCGLNQAFLSALADGLAGDELRTARADLEGYCCVRIRKRR